MRLEAKDLSFRYVSGGQVLLCNLNLCIESGMKIGLAAPSGQGKTTLCKLLAGYHQPDAGSVLLDGKPIVQYGGSCPVQLIWQNPQEAVDPRMQIHEILAQGGEVDAHRLKALGIQKEWMTRYPGTLSGGELQRICIARALGTATKFLLCDEMTAMLDLVTQSQIWRFLLDEQKHRNLGMLIISHSPDLLQAVCDTVLEWPPQ